MQNHVPTAHPHPRFTSDGKGGFWRLTESKHQADICSPPRDPHPPQKLTRRPRCPDLLCTSEEAQLQGPQVIRSKRKSLVLVHLLRNSNSTRSPLTAYSIGLLLLSVSTGSGPRGRNSMEFIYSSHITQAPWHQGAERTGYCSPISSFLSLWQT